MSISRTDILNEKNNIDSISPEIIKQISVILKYVEIKKSTVFNKNLMVGLLNKLTDRNKSSIYEQIIKLLENKDDLDKYLEEMFSHIFSNSLKQSKFLETYVELIDTLNSKYPESIPIKINNKVELFLNTINTVSNKTKDINDKNYDDLCLRFKNIEYINGYSKFIAYLYNFDLYTNINTTAFQLMDIISNETDIESKKNLIDGLFNMITSINCKKLTSNDINTLIEKTKQLKLLDISNKSKFQLMDIDDYLSENHNI